MNHSNKYLSAGWRGLAALVVVASPAFATTANAAAFDFSGGAVAGCPLSGVTYTCPPSISTATDTIAVASGYILTITGSGELVVGTATLGVDSGFNGSLTAMATIALGAGAYMNGDLNAGSTAALGAGAYMNGDLNAGTTAALGAEASMDGDLSAGTTVALGAGADMKGDLTAGTTAALGANAYLEGNLTASTTVALGAGAHVHGNVESTTTFVTMGANAAITGNLTAAGAATLGAAASVCLNLNSGTATLGADAYVNGNVQATTATLGVNAYVNGRLAASTVTLRADACYGSLQATTLTMRIGAGRCTLPRPATLCSADTDGDWIPDDVDPCPEDVDNDGTCQEVEEDCYWVPVGSESTEATAESYFAREHANAGIYGDAVEETRTASINVAGQNDLVTVVRGVEEPLYEEVCYIFYDYYDYYENADYETNDKDNCE
jgi:cytoskeletal protein CcmA (bactofilin family)